MNGRRFAACLIALSATCGYQSAQAEPVQLAPHRWDNVPAVVAFGDVHGAYAELHQALQAAGLIDEPGNWTGGTTHLVSLGDLLDRGDDSRKVMDLLIRLQEQALAAGGRLHVVLGNHEIMNLTGDLRYVAPGEYAAFADANEAAPSAEGAKPAGYDNHRRAFAGDGEYGQWLLQLPLILQINDTVFVHGGLPPLLAQASITDVNARFADELSDLLSLSEPLQQAGLIDPDQDLLRQASGLLEWLEHPDNTDADAELVRFIKQFVSIARSDLFSWQSPNWYRGTAVCAEPVEDALLTAALAKQGASRVVVGHTPTSTRRVQQRFDARAVLADTGMLKPYYQGQAALVFINGDELAVQYPATGGARTAPDAYPILERSQAAIEALLRTAELPAKPAAEPFRIEGVSVVFEPGRKRTNNAKVAAYRLSELLGWHLVPVTVDRGNGVLVARPRQALTEAQRIAADLRRPNHCAVGNAYQLMYAFDALIQNERSAASMVYDQGSWRLFLTGHGDAFGRGRTLPKYLAGQLEVLPGGALDQLAQLSDDNLNEALLELLSENQIKALLKRRDKLLEEWEPLSLTP